MNFIIDNHNFHMKNIALMDYKKNIVLEGYFTKISYLSQWNTMSCLLFFLPIEPKLILNENNTLGIKFDAYSPSNLNVVKYFSKLEDNLLNYYMDYHRKKLKKCNLLNKQLFNGFIKINTTNRFNQKSKKYIIKISGIWETKTEIGITYKIFEANSVNL